ncbi:18697_t:CDS:2 [Funneliformis geosporum]|nr:18697_t:CDS:2 [Funneliformis geosporum]
MAIDNKGSSEKINGKIWVFFDVLVLDGKTPDDFEIKKKTYLRIYMYGTDKRKTAIKAVQDNNYETTSDNLYSFYSFAFCWQAFALKIQVEFNDSDYDWHFIMERAYHINILKWMWERMTGKAKFIVKPSEEGEKDLEEKEYMSSPIKIKISVKGDFTSSFLKLLGCIPIDVWVCLKKRFPCSEIEKESSLKFFLQNFFLSAARKMYEVANYCIIDVLHCQKLLVKLSIINDYREVASIAYVSLFDVHYYANGIKIRHLLSAYAVKRDIIFSMKIYENIKKGKYPDTYVFLPKKGIEKERPVTENLFNKRVELKIQLVSLGKKKEQLGKLISSAKEKDSKQKALKVYMKPFYGKAKNSKSLIFLCELAEGTTSAGKYNLNLIAEFIIKKGFGIKYKDTDSLYLTCSDKYYEKCDKAFSKKEFFKEVYWTEMVKITMNVMKKLHNQVNTYLRIKSRTFYLNMVYEDVLFPICFTGKKKYFEIGHEDVINFKLKIFL